MAEIHSSSFQQAIDTVEQLPVEDQIMLIEIIRRHLLDQRRTELADEIAESRTAYQRGEVTRGRVEELLKDLAE
jgi:hypothetical protein